MPDVWLALCLGLSAAVLLVWAVAAGLLGWALSVLERLGQDDD